MAASASPEVAVIGGQQSERFTRPRGQLRADQRRILTRIDVGDRERDVEQRGLRRQRAIAQIVTPSQTQFQHKIAAVGAVMEVTGLQFDWE